MMVLHHTIIFLGEHHGIPRVIDLGKLKYQVQSILIRPVLSVESHHLVQQSQVHRHSVTVLDGRGFGITVRLMIATSNLYKFDL